jgi:hypothetical protein
VIPKSGPDLPALDVPGVDAEEDVGLVLELLEKAHLDVRVEAGQHPSGVHVVDDLAAEFEIELVLELADAVQDGRGLLAEIFFVVESDACRHEASFPVRPRPAGSDAGHIYQFGRARSTRS